MKNKKGMDIDPQSVWILIVIILLILTMLLVLFFYKGGFDWLRSFKLPF